MIDEFRRLAEQETGVGIIHIQTLRVPAFGDLREVGRGILVQIGEAIRRSPPRVYLDIDAAFDDLDAGEAA